MLLNVSDSYLPHNLLITVSTYVLKVWSTVVSGIFFQANTHSDGFETGAIYNDFQMRPNLRGIMLWEKNVHLQGWWNRAEAVSCVCTRVCACAWVRACTCCREQSEMSKW